jgi:GTP:adenosylcobinamide-phosphate guanylyltransferase
MAGNRGKQDPLAVRADVSHKCLVEVVGTPMLIRVLETLEAASEIKRIVLCVEHTFESIAAIDERIARGSLVRLDAANSPASSALKACDELDGDFPLLIVTADHPLLSTEMITHFCTYATHSDVAVGLADADLVLRKYHNATRTLLKFSDGARCGCNLFALNNPRARDAAMFWRTLEAERKRPWKMIKMLGPWSLIRYLCGRLSLSVTLAMLSEKLNIEAQAVDMPFAEAAIDVDKPADLELVETIIDAKERPRA